jgi:hypothetical protein
MCPSRPDPIVGPAGAWVRSQPDPRQRSVEVRVGVSRVPGVVGPGGEARRIARKAGGVRRQVPERDRVAVPGRELRVRRQVQVAGVLQRHLSPEHGVGEEQGGEDLGDRTDLEGGVGVHGHPLLPACIAARVEARFRSVHGGDGDAAAVPVARDVALGHVVHPAGSGEQLRQRIDERRLRVAPRRIQRKERLAATATAGGEKRAEQSQRHPWCQAPGGRHRAPRIGRGASPRREASITLSSASAGGATTSHGGGG